MRIRTYSEMVQLESFEERYDYLKLDGTVGRFTFGFERYLNQRFYSSREWRLVRRDVIARDLGLDLGVEGYEVHYRPVIHHLNPMNPGDLHDRRDEILDPEFLVMTAHATHNAIHYGDRLTLPNSFSERRPGDTKLW